MNGLFSHCTSLAGKFTAIFLAGILSTSQAFPEWRNEKPEDVDFVIYMYIPYTEVSVASTKAKKLIDTVSAVSVIDRQMIDSYHFQTISEAVNTVAGLDVIRTNFMNTVPMSRGILQHHYANKTLVMINNIPSWLTTTGEGFIDRVHINDVERIEILKGPASVLYGSNAYSGVINIILKHPKKDDETLKIHGGVGTQKSYFSGGHYSVLKGGKSLFISANSSNEEGHEFHHLDGAGVTNYVHDKAGPVGANFTLNASLKNHSFLINSFLDKFTGLEGSLPTFARGAGKPHVREGYLTNYTYTRAWNKFDIKYLLTQDWNRRDFSRYLDDSSHIETYGSRTFCSFISDISFIKAIGLTLGSDYERRKMNNFRYYDTRDNSSSRDGNLKSRQVHEYSGWGQIDFQYNPFDFTLGTRLTRNTLFGSNLSSRGTLVCALNKNHSLKFIVGQSYRAPSFFELYFQSSSRTVAGNTKLSPETCNSYEIAYLLSLGQHMFIQVMGYEAHYKGKIERQTRTVLFDDGVTQTGVRQYVNGDPIETRGLEIEFNYRNPSLLDAFAQFSAIAPRNNESYQTNFRFVPDYTIASGLSKNIKTLTVSGVVKHRSRTDGRLARVGTFTTGDLNLSYQHGHTRHIFAVKNITNKVVLYPEYVWQSGVYLNTVPSEQRRRISYSFQIKFGT